MWFTDNYTLTCNFYLFFTVIQVVRAVVVVIIYTLTLFFPFYLSFVLYSLSVINRVSFKLFFAFLIHLLLHSFTDFCSFSFTWKLRLLWVLPIINFLMQTKFKLCLKWTWLFFFRSFWFSFCRQETDVQYYGLLLFRNKTKQKHWTAVVKAKNSHIFWILLEKKIL